MSDAKSPVKIFVIGDPHFKVKTLKETEKLREKIQTYLDLLRPDAIVCLGDLNNDHNKGDNRTNARTTAFMNELRAKAPTFLIVGNHDMPSNTDFLTGIHWYTAMKQWKNFYVVDKPFVAKIKDKKFGFVPYVYPGRFQEALDTVNMNLKELSALFTHQEFHGIKMGPKVSEKGDRYPEDGPLVINGHIHDYQIFNNIVCVGTPYQQNFGENSNKKLAMFEFADFGDEGLKVVEFKEKDIDEYFHPATSSKITMFRYPTGIPKKVTQEITAEEAYDFKPKKNSCIQLIIRGSSSEISTLQKTGVLAKLKPLVFKITLIHENDQEEDEEKEEIDTTARKKQKPFLEYFYELCTEEEKEKFSDLFSVENYEHTKSRSR